MHRHAKWFAPVVAVLFGLTACEDPTTPPPGTPAEVTVHAYVDADGSGDFSPGDPVITGATVTLTPTGGGQVHTATTGEDGIARLDAVPPGSYVASLEGDIPAGAVVSGAAQPVVVVPFQGGQVEAEFRFAYQPGSITGVVFRDDGDGETTPGEGLQVNLFRGEATEGEPLATTSTDAQGRFHFGPLRPGTYTVEVVPFGSLEIVGGTTRTFEVTADAATELAVEFTGEFVITVEEARAAETGETVVVEGIVTVPQGNFGREIYVQDATGGILVFLASGDTGYELGDSVRVTGTRDAFRDNIQITNSPTVEILGEGTVPEPRPISGTDLNARTYEGELAAIGGITVDSIATFSFDNHAVYATAPDGEEIELYVDSRSGIASDDWDVGSTYDVTGVLTVRDGVARLNPRMPEDVVPADDVEVSTIAEARAAEDGTEITVIGVVLADQGTYDFQNRDTYIQDGTAGVRLWGLDSALDLEVGDSVRVSGTMSTFNDERQLTVSSVVRLGEGTVPAPRQVTGAEINSFEFDGELGITGPVTVVSVQVFSFDAHNVTVEDADGVRFVVRMDSPNEIPSTYWEEGQTYRVTGVLARFRDDGQIKPRGFDDVEEL